VHAGRFGVLAQAVIGSTGQLVRPTPADVIEQVHHAVAPSHTLKTDELVGIQPAQRVLDPPSPVGVGLISYADLTGANLTNANLTGANLSDAFIGEKTNLKGAKLTGAALITTRGLLPSQLTPQQQAAAASLPAAWSTEPPSAR
jgi:hypothetical protein